MNDKDKKERLIHYKVDDEPETTNQETLTATQIMSNAGIDPASNYLTQLVPGGDPISYKDNPNQAITMKNGVHFITKPTGPMPVS